VALKLSNKYINVDAKLQVNISGQARLRILNELSSASRLVFQQAQQEVFILMQTGTSILMRATIVYISKYVW
jgi:hypothetical protein